ncbi:MAG: transcriptional repressor [Bacteroidales bacterium]|nr:transcriptional repressor [Bacteroidales bacterium]
MNDSIELLFRQHGVRPTAIRVLVWRTLSKLDFAFALSDLEGLLPTVDRSTLFRALSLFVENDLLHVLDDGSGQQKYCIHQNQHVHLSCTVCGKTICLEDEVIPEVHVPEGFEVQHITYIIQGVCAGCAHKTVNGHRAACVCHNHER